MKLTRITALGVSAALIFSMSSVVLAEEVPNNVSNNDLATFVGEPVDPNELFNGASSLKFKSNNISTECIFKDFSLEYDKNQNVLHLTSTIEIDGAQKDFQAYGNMYKRDSVDHDKTYIGDMNGTEGISVTYFELYEDNAQHTMMIYIEEDNTGKIYTATVDIPDTVFKDIDSVAYNSPLNDEKYEDLLLFNTKSKNYAFSPDESQMYYEDPAVSKDNKPSIEPAQARKNDWLKLLRDQSYSTIDYSDYSVDYYFFHDLNTTAGQAQWRDYIPSGNSFVYRMVRCAYYQAYTKTYTFYYSMIRPSIKFQGGTTRFYFGFVDEENDIKPASHSYRVELNRNTHQMRYVANYGLKFKPTLRMTISTGTYTRITSGAQIQGTQNAYNILMFFVGLIPKNVGTGISALDLIRQYGSEVPDGSGSRVWVKTAGEGNKQDAVISLSETSLNCYKPQDQIYVIGEVSDTSATVNYSWSYSVSVG